MEGCNQLEREGDEIGRHHGLQQRADKLVERSENSLSRIVNGDTPEGPGMDLG